MKKLITYLTLLLIYSNCCKKIKLDSIYILSGWQVGSWIYVPAHDKDWSEC